MSYRVSDMGSRLAFKINAAFQRVGPNDLSVVWGGKSSSQINGMMAGDRGITAPQFADALEKAGFDLVDTANDIVISRKKYSALKLLAGDALMSEGDD